MYAFVLVATIASASPAAEAGTTPPTEQVEDAKAADEETKVAQGDPYGDPYGGGGGDSGGDTYNNPPPSSAPPMRSAPSGGGGGGGSFSQGLADGQARGAEESAMLWGGVGFGATCLFGVIGCLGASALSYILDPSVPRQPGKSEEYNAGFREGYMDEVKTSRLIAALIGGGVSVAVVTVAVIAFYAIGFIGLFATTAARGFSALAPPANAGLFAIPPPMVLQE
jgi:hypothetical protein